IRRWPQLWSIVCGDFTWVGNRPLSPTDAAELATDFERLWLVAPVGLISLADAEACADFLSDQARAHASYYAVQAHWKMDLNIIMRVLLRARVEAPAFAGAVDFPSRRSERYILKEQVQTQP